MPYDLLLRELNGDSARPFITFYDDATGERVELSVATFNNWVAKTAGLLRDGLGTINGDRVTLDLPAHWQALVWAMACWATGTEAVIGKDGDAAVAVTGPDLTNTYAPDVVALSLRPLGGRFTDPLPENVTDYAVEVPAYPDHLRPYTPPSRDDPALSSTNSAQTIDELVRTAQQRATTLGIGSGARILVGTDDLEVAIADALLIPLVTSGSAVLVRNEDADRRAGRIADEKVWHAM